MNDKNSPAFGRRDWHCHLLPGLDDGPATTEEAVAMAAGLQAAGFTSVYCTPHLIKGAFDADSREVRAAVAALQRRLEEERIDLKLFPGREYYLDEFLFDYLQDPLPLGDGRALLIEFPDHLSPQLVQAACFRLTCSGFTPVIAHPERCRLLTMPAGEGEGEGWFAKLTTCFRPPVLAASPLLSYLRDIGCGFQGNLGSFAGYYGGRAQQNAGYLWETASYSCFGTDAHSLRGIEGIERGSTVWERSGTAQRRKQSPPLFAVVNPR